jgi:hypothetical protein
MKRVPDNVKTLEAYKDMLKVAGDYGIERLLLMFGSALLLIYVQDYLRNQLTEVLKMPRWYQMGLTFRA